jgi:hypothetical protein
MEASESSFVTQHNAGAAYNLTSREIYASGISWAAVIAGAFVVAALWLILITLGAGIGLSAVSPWSHAGASRTAVGAGGIIWLIVVQIIASGMGGYLAGRLRTKWAVIHTDEVYFRDTVHGFLAWSVGLVASAAFLTSAAAILVIGQDQRSAPASASSIVAPDNLSANASVFSSMDYFVGLLFRSGHPLADNNDAQARAEADIILTHALEQKTLAPDDQAYLAQLVTAKTGLSAAASERRVKEAYAELRQNTDDIRKAAAHLSLWLFIALLIGAFCASYAATVGGKQRDQVVLINNPVRN